VDDHPGRRHKVELAVEDAVYNGVHGAVDVTEPREDGEDERRHAGRTTQRAYEVHCEERTPRCQRQTNQVDERLNMTTTKNSVRLKNARTKITDEFAGYCNYVYNRTATRPGDPLRATHVEGFWGRKRKNV